MSNCYTILLLNECPHIVVKRKGGQGNRLTEAKNLESMVIKFARNGYVNIENSIGRLLNTKGNIKQRCVHLRESFRHKMKQISGNQFPDMDEHACCILLPSHQVRL